MNKDTLRILKSLAIIVTIIFVMFGACQLTKAQITQFEVPNEERHPDGTSTFGKTVFSVLPNEKKTCFGMWWDVEFFLTTGGDGHAYIKLIGADGTEEIVAGFTSESGTVTYTDWHAGAYVFPTANFYDVFQVGRVVKFTGNRSETLDVNFEMQPYSNFIWNHGCTQMVFVSEGGLEITPLSTVTMTKDGMTCPSCDQAPVQVCQTICLRNTYWWSNQNVSRYTVAQYGVNFGKELPANNAVVTQNLRKGNANGQAAAFQLQFQIQQVPPQNAGWAECYGVNFQAVTLSDGTVVDTKTALIDINRLLKNSISHYNAEDFSRLVPIITQLNNVQNCQYPAR